MASMEEIYEKSDIISLHCPLTENNYQMINKDTIDKMKDGVILLNTGRGGLLCETDVREALDSGKIGAAGVDVASTEPIRKDNPLLKAKNIFITPHIAWAPRETRQRLMDQMNRNLKAFLKGEPVNQVQ